jgi:uncharacterized protein
MTGKLILKNIFKTLLVIFILMNTVAFFHAYQFTHFDDSEKPKTQAPEQLTLSQKIGILFFGANMPKPENKTSPAVPYQTVKLNSNKVIEGWLISTGNSKGTVILFHGYGSEKSSLLDKAAIFQRLGYSTLLVDFMGSGGSEGNQTTIGFQEARQVKTCTDFLKQRGEQNIILCGTSLGATAIMKALDDHQLPVSAIIIECPFSTMLKTVENRFVNLGVPTVPMAHLLVFWGGVQHNFNAYSHNPVEYAKNIRCPTLLLYGGKDDKVVPEETEAIFNNLAGPKALVTFPGAGHENYLTRYREEWTAAVASFLEQGRPVAKESRPVGSTRN